MAIDKITENDFVTYGLDGAEDIPENPRETLQKFEKKVLMPKINDIIDGLAAVNPDSGGIIGAAENGFGTYTHKKTNKQHELTNDEFDYQNIKFIATADFEDGDTFVVNRLAKTAQTQDGEPLSGGYFKSGNVVTAFLNGDTLNFKSGGAGLNFTVVGGTTQPASPKENTIWVNTDAAISGWVFSAAEPTPSSGLVWIQIGITSGVAFNALKKNSIVLCPLSAKQYIDGSWVSKTAKSYMNGSWSSWATFLYDAGTLKNGISSIVCPSSSTAVTEGEDSFALTAKTTSQQFSSRTAFFDPAFDFSQYSVLRIVFSAEVNQGTTLDNYDTVQLGLVASKSNATGHNPHTFAASKLYKPSAITGDKQTAEIDISSVSGNYYIAFVSLVYNATTTITVYSVECL